MPFRPVPSNVDFPAQELQILDVWKDGRIYEKSLERRADAPPFVFFEGPPTANGMPHPGHCLTRAIKDLFPRYRTMRGFRCERKAGWDTHGLPVEVEVCKELGIHSKEEIEAYGIEPFIHLCQQSVWRYMREWERLTERIGFWIRLDEAYVTYHQSFIESVWWALANLFNRGLLYQGHKIVWWWAQGGTALSSGEVGQGYREVADPSVYVRFPLVDAPGELKDASLLVWTTTPWTLPSNQFAAVHPDLEYSLVVDDHEGNSARLIIASALVEALAAKVKRALRVEKKLTGKELLGLRYRPPFDHYYNATGATTGKLKDGGTQHVAWRIVPADFVTTDSGSGVVHQAPAFGEADFDVLKAEQARFVEGDGPDLICAVGPDGKFTRDAKEYEGRWVKDCDKDISRELRHRGLLWHQEQYLHDYPFCWRAEQDPLIQYPRRSWFIRTSQFKEQMLANNAEINWLPDHIRDGRFGNFLATNVDWALSRERYWGTPLPVWQCQQTGQHEAVPSYAELLAKPGVSGMEVWEEARRRNPDLSEHLKIHKPYIDEITYDSPFAAGARMRRVPEVIDCWFDSGAMPFAQWGYPHGEASVARFEQNFPADFISEAIDQTRGWFYSQLAISTLLFGEGASTGEGTSTGEDASTNLPLPVGEGRGEGRSENQASTQLAARREPRPPGERAIVGAGSQAQSTRQKPYPHPFRNCIVLGLMLGEDGQKMSKSKRNYRTPGEIFDRYGADALRWYFFAAQPPWTSIRYSEQSIKESIPEFLLRLWNVYSFLVIYANIDGFDPAAALAGDVDQLDAKTLSRAKGYRPIRERSELDRWIASELARTTEYVTERMDAYDNYGACQRITAFVDALSNWYVRRSRARFWSGDATQDKQDAYWTLYESLLTTAKLVAPFVPFLAENLWENLVVAVFGDRAIESVHLCDYPTAEADRVDVALSERMQLVRDIVSLGHSARMGAKLKVRQPLSKVEVILVDTTHANWLKEHAALVAKELNVKKVEFPARADEYISYTILPDLKRLGPKLGKQLPALKKALAEQDAAALLAKLESAGVVEFALEGGPVSLDSQDLQIRLQAKPGWAASHGPAAVVVLATELDEALIAEGHVNELVHAVQSLRRDSGCEYTDRIELGVVTDSVELTAAVKQFADHIQAETLCEKITFEPIAGCEPTEVKIAGEIVTLYLKRLGA